MGDLSANRIDTKPATCPDHGEFESRSLVLMGRRMGWSHCPECNRIESDRVAAEKRMVGERERQMRIEHRLQRAGIPARFRGRSFENFVADTTGKDACLRYAVGFAADFDAHFADGTTAVFSGLPGTGKSHLATAICQAVIKSGATAMYANALDLIRMVRSTWRRDSETTESQVMATLADVDLLVIDEVGAQYGTEGEQVILFDVINRRYQEQRPMILLTNHGKDGFKQYIGDRSFDRLREAGKWLAFDWPSYRGRA